jgi:hypothetical protein
MNNNDPDEIFSSVGSTLVSEQALLAVPVALCVFYSGIIKQPCGPLLIASDNDNNVQEDHHEHTFAILKKIPMSWNESMYT